MRRASAIHPQTEGAPPRSAAQNEIVRALTGDVLRRAARCWNAPLDTLAALPAVQNFVYAMDSADGPAILRLTHERHRTAEEVEAELCWIADLAGRKLNVARPRRSRSGAWLEIIESTCGKFIATSFERAAGVAFDLSRPQRWNAKLFEAWGALIAQLHNAARESGWSEVPCDVPTGRRKVSCGISSYMFPNRRRSSALHLLASSENSTRCRDHARHTA